MWFKKCDSIVSYPLRSIVLFLFDAEKCFNHPEWAQKATKSCAVNTTKRTGNLTSIIAPLYRRHLAAAATSILHPSETPTTTISHTWFKKRISTATTTFPTELVRFQAATNHGSRLHLRRRHSRFTRISYHVPSILCFNHFKVTRPSTAIHQVDRAHLCRTITRRWVASSLLMQRTCLPHSSRTLTSVSRHFVFVIPYLILLFFTDLPQQHSENLAHDDVRRDFDMNGRTMEVHENFFVPSASSTPMIHRRMTQIHYQTASYQQQSPPHMMQYQPQQRFMQPPEFKRKMLPPKKKFKPNKKSLEDVSEVWSVLRVIWLIASFTALRLLQEQWSRREDLPLTHSQRRIGARSVPNTSPL